MRLRSFILPLFLVFYSIGYSQSVSEEKADQNYYLFFDVSKSLPGNLVHDKLHFLRINSENIQLPNDVLSYLDSLNDTEEVKDKYKLGRVSTLKVLYNPKIKLEDKVFFCTRILEKNSEMYINIHSFLEDFLKKN